MSYIIVNSRKEKGKALKEHNLKEIIPRGFDAKIEETQKQHQHAITDGDSQIQALEFANYVERLEI